MSRRPTPRTIALRDTILACLRNAEVPLPTKDVVERVQIDDVWYPDVYTNLRALERAGAVERSTYPPYIRDVFWRLSRAERAKSYNTEFEALVAQLENGGIDA